MSTSILRLRDYQDSDLEAIHRLDQLCFSPPFRFSKSDMRRFVKAANAKAVLGEVDGELAGFFIVDLRNAGHELVGYLTTIDVDPVYRRRGFARELLRAAEARVKTAGASAMLLHVFVDNLAAIRLYEDQGFTLSRTQQNFYGPGLNAHSYRKPVQ